MKISCDIDGTFLEYPLTLRNTFIMLKKSGHTVGILSNRSEGKKIPVGFSPDFEIYLGNHSEDRVSKKIQAMIEQKIDIHFDDQADLFPENLNVIQIK